MASAEPFPWPLSHSNEFTVEEFQRILIMKPSSLGDIIHALPTFTVLRARYPRASISWFVKRQWAELLERVEGLDHIWPVDSGVKAWLTQVPSLRKTRFDLVLDLQGLFRSGSMSWLAHCPTRLGFSNAREGSPWFYSHPVVVPTADMHAVDRYLLLAKSLGIAVEGPVQFGLHSIPKDIEVVDALLGESHNQQEGQRSKKLIGINPSARWVTKRWPLESFAAVADDLQQEGLGTVVLLGGKEDQHLARDIQRLMKTSPVDLTGKTSLRVLPAVCERLDLLITNDSGPMHIAGAVGTPVVALFGSTSAQRTGPYGKSHSVLSRHLPCSPCFSRTCHHAVNLECLTSISPAQVLEVVRPLVTMPMNHS